MKKLENEDKTKIKKFTIPKNTYLKENTQAFYNTKYTTQGEEGNPDYINDLKNTYGKPDASDNKDWAIKAQKKLDNAVKDLELVVKTDLPKILNELKIKELVVCVVPRSKAESSYNENQLLFKSTIKSVVSELDNFQDSSSYITRTTDTKTTHLPEGTPNYNNNGKMPYVGITTETCTISDEVKDKNILLVDDVYTGGANIDEDAIQALLDKDAKSVTFYAVGACGI